MISYDDSFLSVDGRKVFLMCGEVHYFRIARDLWFNRLLKVKRASFNCVASYIPWNWHELEEGSVVFRDTVPESPYESNLFSRNLESYIQMVKSLGMFFIARPGPYICSEWDSGGHPNWLYKKAKMLRSMDRDYFEAVERWYRAVLPLIARYTVPHGGPTLLLQIENEYFWGDVPYIMKLYEIARKYIDDIPVVTNEDWFIEGTPVANTIDDYPIPWNIEGFDNKVKNYMKTQQGFLKMFMELEGGWFTHFGSLCPTSRGSLPAEWSEVLLKTAIGLGINAVNIYMFCGGTNPGYYTGKYITSSYDFEAPVREWGELSQRYYALKRVAMFVRTFSYLLTRTVPSSSVVEVSNKDVEVFARVDNDGGAVVVLRNLDIYPKLTRIIYRSSVYPYRNVVRVPHRNAKIVLLNVEISGTPFRILYTSSEPLLIERFGVDVVLIVYGDKLESGEIGIESREPVEIMYREGVSIGEKSDRAVVLNYVHSDIDSIAVLESGGKRLYIVAISRDRASRTWYIDDVKPPIIAVSNIYFIGRAESRGSTTALEVELDEESCSGSVLLVSPRPIASVRIAGESVEVENMYGILYRFYLDSCRDVTQPRIVSENLWRYREESLDLGGVEVEAGKPLELLGYTFNGYFIYTIDFSIDRDTIETLKNFSMYISYFNDYATAILNGKPLASGYHGIEVDTSNLLKEGVNRLVIILESTGHTNDGLVYTPNGIVGGIYLGKLDEIQLDSWRYIPMQTKYSREFSMAKLINNPEDLEEMLRNVDPSSGEIVYSLERQGLYIKRIDVGRKSGRYILDLGKATHYSNYFYYPRALIFINRKFISTYTGPIDITEHLVDGINEVAVYIDWSRIALHPVLKVYQHLTAGLWRVRPYTEGIVEEWYREDLDDSTWRSTSIPIDLRGYKGKILWFRSRLNIDHPESSIAPLKLVVRTSGVRALVLFNGQLIGRYVDEGPQREFYIPEPLVKRGMNTVAVAIHVVDNRASIDRIYVEPIYIHKKSTIELKHESEEQM